MSAILGVFGSVLPPTDDAVRTLLGPMAGRGADRVGIWRGEGAVLAVSRYDWEVDGGHSGPVTVVEDGDLVIAADAALFYRDDLLRALAGSRAGATPSHLILEAYRAWGSAGLTRLEGDFACIIYDRAKRDVLCARDFGGRRPLHYADLGDTLVAASTIGGVAAHPAVSDELNLTAVAETAAALFAASHETALRAVNALGAGWLLRGPVGRTTAARWWQPPTVAAADATPFEDGAEELRELLIGAVAQRLDGSAPTSVWLSGGWDSPAVFGAAEAWLRTGAGTGALAGTGTGAGAGAGLRAVSISYPEGDPGREDELIRTLLDHWGCTTHWLDIQEIPFLDHPGEAAADRDEPFVHAFEHWNRALARGSRAVGSRVALDGTGGDLLFSASLLYMADLLRRGRWLALRGEWVAKGMAGKGVRAFFDQAVQPLLPSWARQVGSMVYPHRTWSGPFDSHVPDWIAPDFVRRHGLHERARQQAPPPRSRRLADAELEYYLTHPTGPRLVGSYAGLALEEGVEVRSPFYDRRIIEFAARRPVEERTRGDETKLLLRRASSAWLPAAFLAPRPHRTGGTGHYAGTALRRQHAGLVGAVLRSPLLAELGIVEPQALQRRWTEFLRGRSRYELPLYLTFQTELWLRARQAQQRPAAAGLALASA